MTMQNDLLSDAQLFTTLMSLEMTDRDRSPRGSWKSDTRLEVLAHEIVRYMPDLAQQLAAAGRQKLAA